MCNCVICFRPCQSNTESAGMPRLETLVTRPDASNRLSHVTWVFQIMLRSSVSKHLRFGISTPCRNVSFASAIPSAFWLEHLSDFDRCCSRLTITCVIKVPREQNETSRRGQALQLLKIGCKILDDETLYSHWSDSVMTSKMCVACLF